MEPCGKIQGKPKGKNRVPREAIERGRGDGKIIRMIGRKQDRERLQNISG